MITEQEIKDMIFKALEVIIVRIGDMPYGVDTQEERTKGIVASLSHELYLKLYPPVPENIREAITKLIKSMEFHSGIDYYSEANTDTCQGLTVSILILVQPLIDKAYDRGYQDQKQSKEAENGY